MYNPIDISNFFIQEYGVDNNITPMKLVKLVYISHGWYLGLTDNALIDENPEAWKYGPVVPTVYHFYKKYGSNPIKDIPNKGSYHHILPIEIQSFLRKIWRVYGSYTGLDLSSLTHQVGTPWFTVWEKISNNGFNILSKQIPDNLIKEHYKLKIHSPSKAEYQN